MTPLDWLLLGLVLGSAVLGAFHGFVSVVASLAGWLIGGWAALTYGSDAARMLAGSAPTDPVHLLLGHALCFIGVSLLVNLVAWAMRRLLHDAGLGGLDRVLGTGAGALRGGFVGCVLVLLLGFTGGVRGPAGKDGTLVPLFVPGARWLAQWLPDWARQRLDFDGGDPADAPAAA